ncbi:MAG: DUF4241 domain-containing protein [Chitinophagaceae bacterium]|nr:MAG: DUF4241 domain-containing protein [Chitinophagaceae bacterium]
MKLRAFITALALLTASCTNNTKQLQTSVALRPLDTLAVSIVSAPIYPELFQTAFIKGSKARINESELTLYGVNIGSLKVPSGKIVACDPMHIDEYGIPFTQVFPTGEFPVHLAIARLEQEEMIAFACIQFSKLPVARWEFALQAGQEPLTFGGKKKHGYSVDAGVGMFIDEQNVKLLNPLDVTETDRGIYTALDSNARNSWRYAMYHFGGTNAATFSTGFGDGRYASYIGFDANGSVCQLLTDFELFNWKKR